MVASSTTDHHVQSNVCGVSIVTNNAFPFMCAVALNSVDNKIVKNTICIIRISLSCSESDNIDLPTPIHSSNLGRWSINLVENTMHLSDFEKILFKNYSKYSHIHYINEYYSNFNYT